MGLTSAMSTALTGLNAAETTIDVVGNNLANSNTVGFKASEASFASQFLQTMSLGSSPTEGSGGSGGTNPRQTGLGTMVADITPDFSQGTIEISSNPTDMAIQGDGFFIVEGLSGEQLYTRNGIFKRNAQDQLVTITGNRLLGYGVNDSYVLQPNTELEPIEIQMGTEVAQRTENVYLTGSLSPTGDVANTAGIIQTAILGDGSFTRPEEALTALSITTTPAAVTDAAPVAGGPLTAGIYAYKTVFFDPVTLTEAIPSAEKTTVPLEAGKGQFTLSGFPANDNGYGGMRIYRKPPDKIDYYLVGEVVPPPGAAGTFNDNVTAAGAKLSDDMLTGNYTYHVTYFNASGESRPSPPIECTVTEGRVVVSGFPNPVTNPNEWTGRRVYRNLASDPNTFYQLKEFPNDPPDLFTFDPLTFIDNVSDTDPNFDTGNVNDQLDFEGPPIHDSTLVVNLLSRNETEYANLFEKGTLNFIGSKGEQAVTEEDKPKQLTITDTTTVAQLTEFMESSLGIQKPPGPDELHPIPVDVSLAKPGARVVDSRIRVVSNNGLANSIGIELSDMQLVATGDLTSTAVVMPFSTYQTAVGEGALTGFLAYDSLGSAVNVRLTAVLESCDSSAATYRWFADSPDNAPASGVQTAVGTGLITFDGDGNFVSATETTVSIERRDTPASSPLEFKLNFDQISGLASDKSNLFMSRQDGSGKGVLTSFIVGENGLISGVFSNGVTRDLGQVILARFANPSGLEQKGQNLYASGVNSGEPIPGPPGDTGRGTVISGAQELSNADIGANLIDLILASTMYRGNTRVITTAQQMFDELLALRR